MNNQRILTTLLLLVLLSSCAPAPTETVLPTSTFIPTPSPTVTPTSRPTPVPTATPCGGGKDVPRAAIFTELEPDDSAAGYIRISEVDFNKEKLVFNDVKLNVGTKPGNLSSGGYHERYPPLMHWSPNGNYLAYTWFEDSKGILYIYDYAARKSKWQFELKSNHPSTLHFTIMWSADSNWVYIEVDTNSHYILDMANGIIRNLTDRRIQSVEWHAKQTLLFFESFGQTAFFQYDPVSNQTLQIEPRKFDPTQFEEIGSGSYNTYGRYSGDNDGYLFETSNEDNSRSYYLESSNDPIFELLRIDGSITRDDLSNVYKIIPSPDRSFYLIGGGTNLPFNDEYNTYFTSVAVSADRPSTITSIDSVNGVYPFSWSPDGKSYIGYQYAVKKGEYYIPSVKLVIVEAATNSIIKEYDIEYDRSKSLYGYFLHTMLMDSTGPVGIDIYWP
ncbi:MAG TPA: hypothetical protein VHP14_17860 [Anaerolineales bacterium]|nr:hypothetical protein [Anaerolineales bacterium]